MILIDWSILNKSIRKNTFLFMVLDIISFFLKPFRKLNFLNWI